MFLFFSPLAWPLLMAAWLTQAWMMLFLLRLIPPSFMAGRFASLRAFAHDLTEAVWMYAWRRLPGWIDPDAGKAMTLVGLVAGLMLMHLILLVGALELSGK